MMDILKFLKLVEYIIRNSSSPLLGDRNMTRQDKDSIFKISIALMALRIRKKMFYHIFAVNLYIHT